MLRTLNAAKDTLLGVAPWLPTQSRYGLDSLTTAELTRAIGAGVRGAKVESMEIEIDSRGTTDRARVHLRWNYAGLRAGLPDSVFAKGTSTQTGSRAVVSAFGCHTYETRFFQQIQPQLADLTIKPYISRSGIGGRYVIAFEDLKQRGDVHFYNADDEAPQAHAEGVIDLFAKLHGRFWESPRFETDLSWLETYSRRPGYAFMKRMFGWSERKFMAQPRAEALGVTESVRRLTREYVRNQDRLVRVWEAMTPTLCHGDCHLGNTFGNPDGSAGIYDWQVFHKMNGLRDFAYFMMHSVPTELRRREEKNLLRRYLDGLSQAGVGRDVPSFDSAWDTYRLLTIDGWIIIVFTLAVGGMQPDARMEVTARRAIAAMTDLDLEGALSKAISK